VAKALCSRKRKKKKAPPAFSAYKSAKMLPPETLLFIPKQSFKKQ